MSGQGSESKELTALRDDRDYYESLFQAKAEECIGLVKANTHLKEQVGTRVPNFEVKFTLFRTFLELAVNHRIISLCYNVQEVC